MTVRTLQFAACLCIRKVIEVLNLNSPLIYLSICTLRACQDCRKHNIKIGTAQLISTLVPGSTSFVPSDPLFLKFYA